MPRNPHLARFVCVVLAVNLGLGLSGAWAVESRVVTTDAGEIVLAQVVEIDAPRSAVWAAYTTAAGWRAWAAPVVEVDLRQGGTIRTHYVESAAIGDPGTNTLHIVHYVPEEVLTLRAELQDNWPDVLKRDADRLANVIVFDALDGGRTRVRSYGVGYRDTPELRDLLGFFIPANEKLMTTLKTKLEAGDLTAP